MNLILALLVIGCGSPGAAMLEIAPAEQLAVCAEGPADGDPVVLVPGLSGCVYGFRKLTPLLHEQGLRTIVISPLAVGESSRPQGVDYTMTAQAARLGAVLDSLRIKTAVFVGQGIGGAMVFRLAVERPELLSGFLSIEAGAAEAAISPNTRHTLNLARVVGKMGGQRLLRNKFAENLKKGSGDSSWIDRRTLGRYFRGTGRDIDGATAALTAMTRQTEPWAMAPRLPEIRIPVLVLLGTAPHAGELSEEEIEILRLGLPVVEFREIPGAGHFIYEEQPGAVADAVAHLIAELGAGPAGSSATLLVPGGNGGADLVQPGDRP